MCCGFKINIYFYIEKGSLAFFTEPKKANFDRLTSCDLYQAKSEREFSPAKRSCRIQSNVHRFVSPSDEDL